MQTQNNHFNISDLMATIPGIKSRPQITEKYVEAQLTYRLERLRSKFKLSRQDIEDVRQDWLLALVVGIKKYQAEKSTWRTFVTAIFDNCYRDHLRKLSAQRQIASTIESIDELDEELDEEPSYLHDYETAFDVKSAIAAMPPRLQRIATMLTGNSPAQSARFSHVSRSTISRVIKKIREHFLAAGFDPQMYGCNSFEVSANK